MHLNISKLAQCIEEVKNFASFNSSQYDQELQENKSLKAEVRKTTNEFNHLKEEFNNLEQYSRRDCLEIRGVPVQRDGDTNALVMNIGRRMGVEVKGDDISTSHSPPIMNSGRDARSRISSLIVKFVRRDVRAKFSRPRNSSLALHLEFLVFHELMNRRSLLQKVLHRGIRNYLRIALRPNMI